MDIIIGASACFGIKLQENFRAPLLSKTVQEFWQRWHISLGGWLKNYVMYPLLKTKLFVNIGQWGKKKFGKQGKKIPSYIAMFVVWTLMGLWHGNSWKYIIGEGWWFWSIIVLGQVLEPRFIWLKQKLHINDSNSIWRAFQVVRTWILFTIGMIFFHADSLLTAFHMIKNIFVYSGIKLQLTTLFKSVWPLFGGKLVLLIVCVVSVMQVICENCVDRNAKTQLLICNRPLVLRWILYFIFVFMIVYAGNFGQSDFIYFGF